MPPRRKNSSPKPAEEDRGGNAAGGMMQRREKRFCVDIGVRNRERWALLKRNAKVASNSDFAKKLLDWYERSLTSTPKGVHAEGMAFQSDVSTITASLSQPESGVEPLESSIEAIGPSLKVVPKSHGKTGEKSMDKTPSNLQVTFISNISGTDDGEIRDPKDKTWNIEEEDVWELNKDEYEVFLQDGRLTEEMGQYQAGDVAFDIDDSDDEEEPDDTEAEEVGKGKRPKDTIFRVQDPAAAVKETAGISYVECLLQLGKASIPVSCSVKGCKKPVTAEHKRRGTALGLSWVCPDKHVAFTWWSQPRLRGVNLGDIMLGNSILLSGNNYEKVALMCKFLNVGCVSSASYFRMQTHYFVPAVAQYWQMLQETTLEKYAKKDIIVEGDGRNDSPGHCAQYCTYTFMESETQDILALEHVDKRETGKKSPNMEKLGFQKGLQKLMSLSNVVEVVTDQHIQIATFLRSDHPQVFHSFDLWHVAKNFVKKLWEAAKKKSNRDLEPWISSVSNHLWYCAKECKGDLEHFMGLWNGVLAHTTGVHKWAREKCTHGQLDESDKKNLVAGESAHKVLTDIVLNNRFLKHVVPHIIKYRQTSQLESFHQMMLMYASKRFSYTPPVYKCRIELAAIDYTMHKDRPVLLTAEGNPRYRAIYSKHSKHYRPQPIKEKKKYLYIQDIQRDIISHRLDDKGSMARPVELDPEDPRRISKTINPVEKPPMEEILKKHRSRYDK